MTEEHDQPHTSESEVAPSLLDAYRSEPFSLASFRIRASEVGYSSEQAMIDASKTLENLLGTGGNGNVYKIPGLTGYVLKVPYGGWGADPSVITPLDTVEDPLPTINVGQAVARTGNTMILKEQLGVPAGVPYGEVRSRNEEEGKVIYQHYLHLAATMPQTAYNRLAALFSFLNEHKFEIDASKANNLLVDKENEKFNLVDPFRVKDNEIPQNTFSYMVVPLMDNAYAWRIKEPELEKKLTEYRKTILLKAFEACKAANLPIPREDDSSLQYSFKLAGLEGEWPTYRKKLQDQ